MVERLVDLVAREAQDGPGRDPQEELHPALHRRPHRRDRPHLRLGQLHRAPSRRRSRCSTTPACARSRRSCARRASTSASASRTYAEICGLGPSQVAGAVGFGGGLWESAIVRFHPSGKVNVMRRHLAARPGRGDDVRADRRERARRRRRRRRGLATATPSSTPMGWGSYGSRSTPVGSGALMGAIGKIKEKAKIVTAHLLEAAVEDIDYADGKFFVKGAPAKSKTIQDVALMANVAWNYPEGPGAGARGLGVLRPAELRLSLRRPPRGRRASTPRPARSSSSATSRSTTAAASSTR